jgi:hypothetical protein
MPVMSQSAAGPEHAGAEAIRARDATAVLANDLQLDHRWGKPCLAYNVFVEPDPAGREDLAAIQDQVIKREPALLRLPRECLHITAVNLLGLYDEFDRPKDELWRERGRAWLAELTRLAAETEPIRLDYRRVVATRTAVIAIAAEPNGLTSFRTAARSALDVPGRLANSHEIVHSTLFRYAQPLRDPAGLLAWLTSTEFLARLTVSELVVAREHLYPFAGYDVLRRLRLAAR